MYDAANVPPIPMVPAMRTSSLGLMSFRLTSYEPVKFEKMETKSMVGKSVCVAELLASGK